MDTLALPLEPSPRSVQTARRWAVDVCARMGRPDLEEAAALGVSELVTNALLHAAPPLAVRFGGTREHPRVEVHDGSCTPPAPPDLLTADLGLGAFLGDLADLGDLGDLGLVGDRTDMGALADAEVGGHDDPDLHAAALLSTQGRGLGIVSMVSCAWGADIGRDGKVVWFEPAPEQDTTRPSGPAVFTTSDDAVEPSGSEGPHVPVTAVGVPVRAYAGFVHHFRELRRELRLLALAHESEYPLARDLSGLLADFEAQLADGIGTDRIETALATGVEVVDLPAQVPATAADVAAQVIELLELADAFCRSERLLSLARTPLQQQFQRWFLGEFVRQADGGPPTPWAQVRSTADSSTA